MKNILNRINAHERTVLLFLCIFALLLRSVFVFLNFKNTGSNWADDWLYISYGKQIAGGNWAPVSDGMPYMVAGPSIPLLIALFVKLFSDPVIPFLVFNIVAMTLVVPVLYYLGKEVFSGNVGWLLAIWGVFNMEFFKYTVHVLKEPAIFLLVPLTLLFLVKSLNNKGRLRYLIFSALAFSLLIHTDERFFIYLPLFALFFLLIKPFNLKTSLKAGGLWIAIVFISLVPWGIRNYFVFDQVVILTPRTTAFTSKVWGRDLAKMAFTEGYKVDSVKYDQAVKFGKERGINPREYGKLESRAKAFVNFWQPVYFKPTYIQYGFRPQQWSFGHNMAGLLFYGIFLPFYLLGAILLIRQRNTVGIFLASLPVIHSLLHAFMVWPLERYRAPVTFLVVMIAMWALLYLYKMVTGKLHISG